MMQFNPMMFMQMMKKTGNPQQFIMNMMRQQGNNNPIINNALNMAKNNDSKGLEQLVRNICKENNMDADKVIQQAKNQFGIN